MKNLLHVTPPMQPFLNCVLCLVGWLTLMSGFSNFSMLLLVKKEWCERKINADSLDPKQFGLA